MSSKVPKVGQLVKVRNTVCRITKVHPAGCIDVIALDESAAFRVSGLPVYTPPLPFEKPPAK